MSGPLSGVTVLDLTNVLAGPFCCQQLAYMGAEVIKVEACGRGDLARQLGADSKLNERNMGVSFLAQNAGKKSVTLNLKHEKGKALFKKLVAMSDVVVENFRPKVMERLGLGHADLKKVNPKIIYCAISGFGQSGPWLDRPAYDQIIQGVSGIMSITGDGQSAPLRAGFPVADTMGGMTAAFAIAAALNSKERGQVIDVSMLESVLAAMGWVVSNYLVAGERPGAHGNENTTSAPSGAFQAEDGLINIAANKDEQWEILIKHLGLDDLLVHPMFLTRELRKRNRVKLKELLEGVLKQGKAKQWAEELNALGVPAGEVLSVPQSLSSEQIQSREFLKEFACPDGVGRNIELARTGYQLNGKPLNVDRPPPLLGHDNLEIWQRVGISPEEITILHEEGVI